MPCARAEFWHDQHPVVAMTRSVSPLYRKVAHALRTDIANGALPVGSHLPPEPLLARRHGVSRHTVRAALDELRALGLIERRQGIGTVVLRRQPESLFSEGYASVEDLVAFARGAPLRPYATRALVADADLAAATGGREGQQYLHVAGLRHGPARPDGAIGHVDVYVDGLYSGILDRLDGLDSSIAEMIETVYGVDMARIEQEVSVVLLSPAEASLLSAPENSPALEIKRQYIAGDGRVFETAFSRYPMGRFVYRNTLRRKPASP